MIYEEREAIDSKRVLLNITEQLRAEKQRADEAERRLLDIAARLKTTNDARLDALQDAARAKAELEYGLYLGYLSFLSDSPRQTGYTRIG